MSSKKHAREYRGGASIWVIRLVSLALVAAVLIVFGRMWFEGVLGCAGMLDTATYDDPDERSRLPEETPIPPMDMFSDSAYDRAFPDLVEPTLNPNETAE